MDSLELLEEKRIKYNDYMRVYMRQYARENKEKYHESQLESKRRFREAHRESLKETDRLRYLKKKEMIQQNKLLESPV